MAQPAPPNPPSDVLSPLSQESSDVIESGAKVNARNKLSDDFRLYEVVVMLTTQLSYIPVAATMLSTTFFEPSVEYCNSMNHTTGIINSKDEFHSLLFEWGTVCSASSKVTVLSMILMSGALAGAFLAGWLADLYGRHPVLKGCLLTIFAGNIILYFVADYSLIITTCLFFLLGSACGGYMVVNLVIFVECLELPQSRLFAVSANGWSISVVAVAFIAFITAHWKYFHLTTATLALVAYIACNILLVESCRWLDSVQKAEDAYRAAIYIAKKNKYKFQLENSWWEILRFSSSAVHDVNNEQNSTPFKSYNYLDLFRFSYICIPLLSLAYCFIASSIVTFGFYYFLDVLPGNRYLNMALMGSSKFLMGWIPFFASPWMGRRPIVAASVGIATMAAWLACFSIFVSISQLHFVHVALSLIISASLDPTWKILHLYSTELFPTVVRTQARAVCNIAARLGSVIAPAAVYLRTVHPLVPLAMFTALLTFQLIAVLLLLPETKDKPLPSTFSSKRRSVQKLGDG